LSRHVQTQLLITNLTGHPAIILRTASVEMMRPRRMCGKWRGRGWRPGTPLSRLFWDSFTVEAKMLAVAKAYQDATDFHRKHRN